MERHLEVPEDRRSTVASVDAAAGRAALAAPCRADQTARCAAGRRCKRPSRVAPRPLKGGVGGRRNGARAVLSRMDRFSKWAVARSTGSGGHHDARRRCASSLVPFARPRLLTVASRHGGGSSSSTPQTRGWSTVRCSTARPITVPWPRSTTGTGPHAPAEGWCLAVARFWCLTCACS